MWRVLLLAAASSALPRPQAPESGFRPVQGARGPSLDAAPPRHTRTASFASSYGDSFASASQQIHHGAQSFGSSGNRLGEPDKTIFVRLPEEEGGQVITRPPQSAGPPQKHYRIVIIRNPTPPEIQPILPPKTEQKTVIYVLHQKPKVQQQVIETPVVKHPPQVLFVGYDEELSSDDLQKLAQGDHSGFTVTSQQNPGEVGQSEQQGYN